MAGEWNPIWRNRSLIDRRLRWLARRFPVWNGFGGACGASSRSERRWMSAGNDKPVSGIREQNFDSFPIEKIRNFSIIAHVDHGKSTLADRLLEVAGNVKLGEERQLLDDLKVERERGITVKARTATMIYDGHLINLIDTPGHVDFETEVRRSLACCEGALLLIDSSQGVQAQTIANHQSAIRVGLKIIPVLTKLDLPHSDPAMALEQIEKAFGYPEEATLWTSAKTGEGCELVLPEIIKKIPAPRPPNLDDSQLEFLKDTKFRGKVVDSWYDKFRGTVCLVKVDHGNVSKNDEIVFQTSSGKCSFTVGDLGVLLPHPTPRNSLKAGMVGFLTGSIRDRDVVQVGDWFADSSTSISQTLISDVDNSLGDDSKGTAVNTPKVFASVFPVDDGDFGELSKSIERLTMNDSGVTCMMEKNGALGAGFRCGFLGKLHMEVFIQRLQDEFETEIIATAPSVPYQAVMKDGSIFVADNPTQLPEMSTNKVLEYRELMSNVTVMTPSDYLGAVMKIFQARRGRQISFKHLDGAHVVLEYSMPWQDVIVDLHDVLKSTTSGFANFEYEEGNWEPSDICVVSIHLNGKPVEPLAFICHRSCAEKRGRKVALKVKENIKRQQFEVIIQAAIGRRFIARERIPPVRKDVLTKSGKTVGGGDITRKMKLLRKQKEGKKRMKSVGNVQLSQQAFLSVLERE